MNRSLLGNTVKNYLEDCSDMADAVRLKSTIFNVPDALVCRNHAYCDTTAFCDVHRVYSAGSGLFSGYIITTGVIDKKITIRCKGCRIAKGVYVAGIVVLGRVLFGKML